MISSRRSNIDLSIKENGSKRAFFLLKRSFVTPNVLRKYPLLSSLHRGVDGALVGVMISGAVMTGLALHSQHLWTVNFSRLQLTKDLNHRLQESTAMLERHFLSSASGSNPMVATKSTHLLYIDKPRMKNTFIFDLLNDVRHQLEPIYHPISNGY